MVGGSESRRRGADELTSHRQKTLPRPISNKEVIKGASKCAVDFEGQPVREGSGKGVRRCRLWLARRTPLITPAGVKKPGAHSLYSSSRDVEQRTLEHCRLIFSKENLTYREESDFLFSFFFYFWAMTRLIFSQSLCRLKLLREFAKGQTGNKATKVKAIEKKRKLSLNGLI